MLISALVAAHNRAVENIDKEIIATPDVVGINQNVILNRTGMPTIPVVARPPKPLVLSWDEKEKNERLMNAKVFEEEFNKAMGNNE